MCGTPSGTWIPRRCSRGSASWCRGQSSSGTRRAKSSGRHTESRSKPSRPCRASRWGCTLKCRSAGRSTRCSRPRSSRRSATKTRSAAPCSTPSKGVRDGMVQYSINDISKRTQIANTMEGLVDSALVTRPRAGGGNFRIATVTAFFLRDLQPPPEVVQAINNKIAQEQQIEPERHRVEVARLQTEQQRLLNQTLSPEALTKQWIEVLHDMKGSSNLIIFVPTEGGLPLLNISELRKNLKP